MNVTHTESMVCLHRGHIFAGETVGCVGDEHARLADGAVADDDAFDRSTG